jgi:hypothetical protein
VCGDTPTEAKFWCPVSKGDTLVSRFWSASPSSAGSAGSELQCAYAGIGSVRTTPKLLTFAVILCAAPVEAEVCSPILKEGFGKLGTSPGTFSNAEISSTGRATTNHTASATQLKTAAAQQDGCGQ